MEQSQKPEPKQYERVVDTEGNAFHWPGKISDGDYFPSRTFALLQPGSNAANRQQLKNWILSFHLFDAYGTQSEVVLPQKKTELLAQYNNLITENEKVRKGLEAIIEDRFVYKVCLDFLHEGGRISAMPGLNSHFNASRKVLEVGVDFQDLDINIGHELMHHMTSKIRSPLWRRHTDQGLDHEIISPLEDRLRIIKLLHLGKAPISPASLAMNGYTEEGKIYEQLNFLISERDVVTLENYTQSEQFYTAYVHAGMLRPLWVQSDTKVGGTSFLTAEHIQDIAYLHAFNAVILQYAFKIAISCQKKEQVPVSSAFASEDFKVVFKKFIFLFVRSLEKEPFISLRQTAAEAFNKSLLHSSLV